MEKPAEKLTPLAKYILVKGYSNRATFTYTISLLNRLSVPFPLVEAQAFWRKLKKAENINVSEAKQEAEKYVTAMRGILDMEW